MTFCHCVCQLLHLIFVMSLLQTQQKYVLAQREYIDALKENLFPDSQHLDLDILETYIRIKYHFNFTASVYNYWGTNRKIDATMPIEIEYVGGPDRDQGCPMGTEAVDEIRDILIQFYKLDPDEIAFDNEYHGHFMSLIPESLCNDSDESDSDEHDSDEESKSVCHNSDENNSDKSD